MQNERQFASESCNGLTDQVKFRITRAEWDGSSADSLVSVRGGCKSFRRIEAAAKRRGISRSAWIQYTLSHVLDEETVPDTTAASRGGDLDQDRRAGNQPASIRNGLGGIVPSAAQFPVDRL